MVQVRERVCVPPPQLTLQLLQLVQLLQPPFTIHPVFDGVAAEHAPLHWIVPLLVCPQAFGAEVQAEPYPEGLAGVEAEQVPLH